MRASLWIHLASLLVGFRCRFSKNSRHENANNKREPPLSDGRICFSCPFSGAAQKDFASTCYRTGVGGERRAGGFTPGHLTPYAVEDVEWAALGGVDCCRAWADSCASFRSSAAVAALGDREAGAVIASSQEKQVRLWPEPGGRRRGSSLCGENLGARHRALSGSVRERDLVFSSATPSQFMKSFFPRAPCQHMSCHMCSPRRVCVCVHGSPARVQGRTSWRGLAAESLTAVPVPFLVT